MPRTSQFTFLTLSPSIPLTSFPHPHPSPLTPSHSLLLSSSHLFPTLTPHSFTLPPSILSPPSPLTPSHSLHLSPSHPFSTLNPHTSLPHTSLPHTPSFYPPHILSPPSPLTPHSLTLPPSIPLTSFPHPQPSHLTPSHSLLLSPSHPFSTLTPHTSPLTPNTSLPHTPSFYPHIFSPPSHTSQLTPHPSPPHTHPAVLPYQKPTTCIHISHTTCKQHVHTVLHVNTTCK